MRPEQLYSRILPFVVGCPEPLVDQAIIDAASEFAEKSQILFTEERPIPLVEGRSTYYVLSDFGLDVDLVRGVYCGSRELRRVTPTSLHDEVPDWETAQSSEPTHYSSFSEVGAITVYPKPTAVNGATLRVHATWAPSMSATSIPDELGRRFFRDIAAGAKAILMAAPDRRWTNLQLAGVERVNFDNAIADARIQAIHTNAAGTITARPQRFGG